MKKNPTINVWKRSVLLVPSLFALVSCSGSVPYWLNEEGRIEFCANVEAMEPDFDYVEFRSPMENYSDYSLFTEWQNFTIFVCEKTDEGLLSVHIDGHEETMEKQSAGEETAYEFGLSCLENYGYKNVFSTIDLLPFAKESAKKAKAVKGSISYPGFWFDMDQSVFDSDSFKTFRHTYFNSRLNKAIDEDGSLYFEVSNGFRYLSLFVGSIDGRFAENCILRGII